MSDDDAPPSGSADRRGAVAKLADAVAAAQAEARESEWDISQPDTASHPKRPRRSAHKRRRRRLWPLHVVMAVFILAVPVLGYVGWRLTSNSTTGEVVSGHSNPQSPGYTALVEPTPVALVMLVSNDKLPRALTVLSLSGPNQRGGSVLASPLNVRLSKPRFKLQGFAALMTLGTPPATGRAIGSELGVGFSDVFKITDSELTRLIEPAAPLEIDNPEQVTLGDGTTLDAGKVKLTAEQIPDYLSAKDSSSSIDGNVERQLLVWDAWITAIKKSESASIIPGETKVGLGHYLTQLALGDIQTASFPFYPSGTADQHPAVKIDRDPARLLVANAVPFPVGALPGDRATVALLNGTGYASAPASVIQRLTFAGAEIATVGNANSFTNATTTLTYSDVASRKFAVAMAKQLGAGRVVRSRTTDAGVDITIVLGRDVMDHPPAALSAEDLEDD